MPPGHEIDSLVRVLMHSANVQGMALATIDGGRVAHVASYGVRNARREPLTTGTVMYGASLTKAAVAYLTLQLVDEGRLSLDTPLQRLLPRALPAYDDYRDLADEPRWRQLTPRHVLSHRTGFANFRRLEPDRRLRMHFAPGERYAYSGEGFYVLQLAIEEGLGLDLGDEMQRRLFAPLGMRRTSMQWRPDFADDLADGFGADGTVQPHDERSRPSAAGSMDTTIEDQALLWAAIVRGDGLSPASRAEFVRAQHPITSRSQFPTLTQPDAPGNAAIGLAAGLGVVTYRSPRGPVWFKGGHNDWTGNMVVCAERERRCLVLLANDVRAERIYPAITRAVLGDIGLPWRWEYDWYRGD